jgi:hypothetical protein
MEAAPGVGEEEKVLTENSFDSVTSNHYELMNPSQPYLMFKQMGCISIYLFAFRTPLPRTTFRKVSRMLSDFLAGCICTMHYN